ncbi:MAG: efflux RND transporter periplasmic adaptor subunit [Anaerolineaceae bacterium]|nr:efflux RND transporter periplasmic adaptor subunit [Anaerolineaceae bacterium]
MKLPEFLGFGRWKKRTKIGLALIGFLALIGAGAAWVLLGNSQAARQSAFVSTSPSYQTAVVRRGDLKVSITGAGTLGAGRSVDLSFSTKGTVAELNVALGDVVKKGDVLAKLGDTEALNASLASAKLAYLEAKQALTTLQQDADVSLAQAYSGWVTAKEKYLEAQSAYQRTNYARCGQDVNTRNAEKLEETRNRLDGITPGADGWSEAKNAYDTALANYSYCIAYTGDEKTAAKAALDLADATMQQAEMKYNRLKEGSGMDPDELALAEAKVNEAETKLIENQNALAGAALIAPMAGKITYLSAGEGEIVGTEKFLTISDLSLPTLEINVDEADLGQFSAGNTANAVFDALPKNTFKGEVIRVDPELSSSFEITTATGWVLLGPDAVEALQSYPLGLSATLEIIQNEVTGAVLAPVEAVHDLGDGQFGAFVKEKDGKLRLHVLEVGMQSDTYVEIINGLNAGDVVTTGLVSTSGS